MLTEGELKAIEENYIHPQIHRLIAEYREIRLVLRDAVQDSTPGNRCWREGVKAGLKAAAKYLDDRREHSMNYRDYVTYARNIRAIDPDTILPG
jgi:hypothetical protein